MLSIQIEQQCRSANIHTGHPESNEQCSIEDFGGNGVSFQETERLWINHI